VTFFRAPVCSPKGHSFPRAHRIWPEKKALFRRIAELLSESPGIRPQDVFVNVLDAAKENWSLGHGVAQFA
jgi:hypothetical protein